MRSVITLFTLALSVSAPLSQIDSDIGPNASSHLRDALQHYSTLELCSPNWLVQYNGKNAFQMITYNANESTVSMVSTHRYLRGYNVTVSKPEQVLLPNNISRLNDYMCSPLNRKGYMCSECIEGFGPSVIPSSNIDRCYDCRKSWYGVPLYLSLQLIPSTVLNFYLFILFFHISVTSAPLTGFIMYSQLTIMALNISRKGSLLSQVQLTETGDLRLMSKVIFTVYGLFNLDFSLILYQNFVSVAN